MYLMLVEHSINVRDDQIHSPIHLKPSQTDVRQCTPIR
jgi:hypothetical protein